MADRDLEGLSKPELIRELRKLRAAEARLENVDRIDPDRLIHDLHVHQVQLEMQNRELREAQGLLEESRSRYVDLYDLAPVGYCTLDEKGRIQEINLTGAALFGLTREQLIGKPVSSLASLAGKDVLQSHVKKCFQEKTRATGEVTLSLKGHDSVVVQVVSTPALDTDGSVTACRTALTDISVQKQLEARLRFLADVGEVAASQGDYGETVAAVARQAVPFLADLCVVDLLGDDKTLRRVEAAFADAKKEAQLAESVRRWVPLRGRRTPQERVIESGEPLLYEEIQDSALEEIEQDENRAKTMRAVGLKSKMVVPLIARGYVLGALTFVAAESDRRYTTADLAFAEEIARRAAMAMDNAQLYALEQEGTRAREDMLAIVSHDLRSPLGTILMSVHVLLSEAAANERMEHIREDLQRIKRAAERMKALIQDLLDTASIAGGQLSIERTRVAPGPVVSEALAAIGHEAVAKSLRLETVIPADLPPVFADPARLQQVFANLLSNAIKFTPEGGTITVRAEPSSGDAVEFSVADTGHGIPHEHLPHLFDRFWQARRKARGGTGLGLFIIKGIVDAHGGQIWADSEIGAGSSFRFTLPVAVQSDRPDE